MRILGLLAVAAAAVAAVQIAAPAVHGQSVDVQPGDDPSVEVQAGDTGVVIDIGPDRNPAELREERRERRRERLGRRVGQAEAVSQYWIGLGGVPVSDELRAQVDIDGAYGLLVRSVAPEGPAAQAGLERFDIVLKANGEPIEDLAELAEIVGEQGERKGKITIDFLRRGQRKTVWVTPIERPLDAAPDGGLRAPRGRLLGPGGEINLGELLGQGGVIFEEHGIEGGRGLGQMAVNGVSVSVRRDGEGPAKVSVQRGEQSWEFDEGDQEAINALPDDVRPMVEGMLRQNGGAFEEGFQGFHLDAPGVQLNLRGEGIADRVRAMQERMRGLQNRLGAPNGPNPGAAPNEPQIELDEAPAFNAAPAPEEVEPANDGPMEIEVPAEPVPPGE